MRKNCDSSAKTCQWLTFVQMCDFDLDAFMQQLITKLDEPAAPSPQQETSRMWLGRQGAPIDDLQDLDYGEYAETSAETPRDPGTPYVAADTPGTAVDWSETAVHLEQSMATAPVEAPSFDANVRAQFMDAVVYQDLPPIQPSYDVEKIALMDSRTKKDRVCGEKGMFYLPKQFGCTDVIVRCRLPHDVAISRAVIKCYYTGEPRQKRGKKQLLGGQGELKEPKFEKECTLSRVGTRWFISSALEHNGHGRKRKLPIMTKHKSGWWVLQVVIQVNGQWSTLAWIQVLCALSQSNSTMMRAIASRIKATPRIDSTQDCIEF